MKTLRTRHIHQPRRGVVVPPGPTPPPGMRRWHRGDLVRLETAGPWAGYSVLDNLVVPGEVIHGLTPGYPPVPGPPINGHPTVPAIDADESAWGNTLDDADLSMSAGLTIGFIWRRTAQDEFPVNRILFNFSDSPFLSTGYGAVTQEGGAGKFWFWIGDAGFDGSIYTQTVPIEPPPVDTVSWVIVRYDPFGDSPGRVNVVTSYGGGGDGSWPYNPANENISGSRALGANGGYNFGADWLEYLEYPQWIDDYTALATYLAIRAGT